VQSCFLRLLVKFRFELQVTGKSDRKERQQLRASTNTLVVNIQWRSIMTKTSIIQCFRWAVQGAVELQLDLVFLLADVHVPL
jgi:hypothetical protein